jgi:hypothetical protein
MNDLRRFGLIDLVLLVAVLSGALAARGWYLFEFADSGQTSGPFHVQDPQPLLKDLPAGTTYRGHSPPSELDALVENLREHQWFGSLAPFSAEEEQTAHVSPGYPWLLAMLERAWGGPSDRTVRWIQCLLGAVTAGVYFLFARGAFQSRLVATLAGALCAVYPFWVINTAEIDDGVLTTFLLAVCLLLGSEGGRHGGAFTSLVYGLSLAGLALVRAALLPFALVSVLWFLLRCRTLRRGWLCALLAFLGFVNGLAAWSYRNFQAFGDVFPIVDSTYFHLVMGNNPRATGGPLDEHTLLEALAQTRKADVKSIAQELERRQKRDVILGSALHKEVSEHPGETLQRRLQALLCFLVGEDWLKNRRLCQTETTAEASPGWLAEAGPAVLAGSLLGGLLLGALGWRWTYGWRHESLPASLAVIWIPLPYLLGHAEALQGPRLPLDGVLLTYAGFVLACLVPTTGSFLLAGAPAEDRSLPGSRPAR